MTFTEALITLARRANFQSEEEASEVLSSIEHECARIESAVTVMVELASGDTDTTPEG